jgi:hypothetical protein
VTLLPTPTVVGDADLVIDTSENPPLTVVFAVTVLLAVLPSGSGELTVNAAVMVPPTFATAGTVRLGALALAASDALRVQAIAWPAHSGYPEEGTHAQLLALGGIYARLWAHQSGGFLGDEAEEA